MTDRHEAALRAALTERDSHQLLRNLPPHATDYLVTRIVEAALVAIDHLDLQGETVTDEKLVEAITTAITQLDAEHYPDPGLKGKGGCVMCWPKDGSWPCVSRMVADELRETLE